MEFQPLPLFGHMHINIVLDPDIAPSNIVKVTDPFKVDVQAHIWGAGLTALGGDFKFEVFAESFGPAPEVSLGFKTLNVSGGVGSPTDKTFTVVLDVAAGTLQPGVYRLMTVLTHSHLGLPTNIVGFEEGPTIQIYTPHPSLP